jgi:hypothetical protein
MLLYERQSYLPGYHLRRILSDKRTERGGQTCQIHRKRTSRQSRLLR